jgi:hypothetical protein
MATLGESAFSALRPLGLKPASEGNNEKVHLIKELETSREMRCAVPNSAAIGTC